VLMDRVSPTPTIESTQGFFNKLISKKNRKHKEHGNSDINFKNKRSGKLIYINLINHQQYHLSSIPVIEVDDHLSNDEINQFISR
jgi:hypothetical protein